MCQHRVVGAAAGVLLLERGGGSARGDGGRRLRVEHLRVVEDGRDGLLGPGTLVVAVEVAVLVRAIVVVGVVGVGVGVGARPIGIMDGSIGRRR